MYKSQVKLILRKGSESMWTCPTCNRVFAKNEQSHYCSTTISSIEQYILEQPIHIQPILNEVSEAIKAVLPDVVEKISWRMPTYWKDHNIIHFAAFKNHLGVYPGPLAIEVFAQELKPYKTSKGAIQFLYKQPIPIELIANIARWCYETGNHH